MDEATPTAPTVDVVERVETTGIALVHQGEYIVPEPDSAARISAYDAQEVGADDSGLPPAQAVGPDEVHYWFPVEIEVVGELDPQVADGIVARVYEELQRELASRT